MQNPDPELIRAIDRYLDALAIVRAEERAAELLEGDCPPRPTAASQQSQQRRQQSRRLSSGTPPHRALESRQQDNGGEQ